MRTFILLGLVVFGIGTLAGAVQWRRDAMHEILSLLALAPTRELCVIELIEFSGGRLGRRVLGHLLGALERDGLVQRRFACQRSCIGQFYRLTVDGERHARRVGIRLHRI